MSRFLSDKFASLIPYVPGEQPQDRKYIKLNTNESPFPPDESVAKAVYEESKRIQLYSDPDCVQIRNKMAEVYGVSAENIIMSNGSDEVLNFAFMAYGDKTHPIAFADITYGFYTVFCDVNNIPYVEIPLTEDMSIDVNDYIGINKTIVIANPNAPTGKILPLEQIEQIVKSNPDNIVVVDEAYVDFGGESAVGLIEKYDNLLVTGTFSKSRSMAGGRLGFGFAQKKIIDDLNTIRYSLNPYNVNRYTMAAAIAILNNQSLYTENCNKIIEYREWTVKQLEANGFTVIPSCTNFIFAKSNKVSGEDIYKKLKERGILVRHFKKERIKDYVRITIGTMEQMEIFIKNIVEITEE